MIKVYNKCTQYLKISGKTIAPFKSEDFEERNQQIRILERNGAVSVTEILNEETTPIITNKIEDTIIEEQTVEPTIEVEEQPEPVVEIVEEPVIEEPVVETTEEPVVEEEKEEPKEEKTKRKGRSKKGGNK